MDRVRSLGKNGRARFDRERYLRDEFGMNLGTASALKWMDLIDEFRKKFDEENEIHDLTEARILMDERSGSLKSVLNKIVNEELPDIS